MRESGYYRVKIYGKWVIGFYNTQFWSLIEYVQTYIDSDFEEIDENRINPEPEEYTIKNVFEKLNNLQHYTKWDSHPSTLIDEGEYVKVEDIEKLIKELSNV